MRSPSGFPHLRLASEQQHRFRSEQLASLVGQESAARADPSGPEDRPATCARREVDAVLVAGARRALIDIELALARMDTGRYGVCRSRGTSVPGAASGHPQDDVVPGMSKLRGRR
jgi:DnaK suppressor protein